IPASAVSGRRSPCTGFHPFDVSLPDGPNVFLSVARGQKGGTTTSAYEGRFGSPGRSGCDLDDHDLADLRNERGASMRLPSHRSSPCRRWGSNPRPWHTKAKL